MTSSSIVAVADTAVVAVVGFVVVGIALYPCSVSPSTFPNMYEVPCIETKSSGSSNNE